ncbi:hypothetical protein [Streptomyces sp. NPDC056707]|uniref:hypothetical protein n=1 Tax=Streptomyces sp. NPDC056707 TaxID=3345919 RepID=UPI0036AA9A2E
MGSSFVASSPAAKQAAKEIAQIGTEADDLWKGFRAKVQAYSKWMGEDDSFAQRARPAYDKTLDNIMDTGTALIGAIIKITDGVTGTAHAIQAQQADVIDTITAHGQRTRTH